MAGISFDNYEQFVNSLHEAGHKTTSIHSDKGEASFLDYGYALGDNVKSMITDSFDCEQDYVLQAQVASVFGNRSVMSNNDFAKALRSIGLNVERFSTKTQYMVDEKNVKSSGGWGSRKVVNGGISMFKISDGKGGEIIIADANGNASLEIEEVFMNQILNNIAVDVNQLIANQNFGANAVFGSSSSSGLTSEQNSKQSSIFGTDKTDSKSKDKKAEKEVTQEEYNQTFEEYLALGYTYSEAQQKTDMIYGNPDLVFTGSIEIEENIFAKAA